jgi:fimbrial chaperone protein
VRTALIRLAIIFAILISPEICKPADLFVTPVKLFFGAKQKTTIIKVKNNSDQTLSLQINTYSWVQDEEAKDQYPPTQDIILFPKILSLKSGEERIIRVGVNVPSGMKEKTYRIFLEELPQPLQTEGNVIRTILKIGIPVFISPAKPEETCEIEKMEFSKGGLSFTVKNKGNVHLIIQSVKVKGVDASDTPVFQSGVESRYLLEGRSRSFSFNIPKENCLKMSTLTIDVATNNFSLGKRLDVIREMCSP